MNNNEISKELIYVCEYIVLEKDISTLELFISDQKLINEVNINIYSAINNKEKILKNMNSLKLNASQRILLGIYSHLYYWLHDFDLFNNYFLQNIRKVMKLNEKFVGSILDEKDIRFLKKYKKGSNHLKTILYPSKELFTWVTYKVIDILKEDDVYKKVKLIGLKDKDFQHEYDIKAVKKLKSSSGYEKAMKYFFKYGIEKYFKIQYIGSNYRINPKNNFDEYKSLRSCCETLDIMKIPDLYVMQGFLNAFTTGVEETIIVVTSGCISLLTHEELQFIYGHEMGHIKCKHVLYHQMADVLYKTGRFASYVTFGLGGIVTEAFRIQLLDWYRKSEFSADRAGLLACQNINAAISCMMKLSGYPLKYYSSLKVDDMINQAKEFEKYTDDELNNLIKKLNTIDNTHPWLVVRCAELLKWKESGEYDKILRTVPVT